MKICHGGHTHTLSTAEEIFLLVFEDKLGDTYRKIWKWTVTWEIPFYNHKTNCSGLVIDITWPLLSCYWPFVLMFTRTCLNPSYSPGSLFPPSMMSKLWVINIQTWWNTLMHAWNKAISMVGCWKCMQFLTQNLCPLCFPIVLYGIINYTGINRGTEK